MFVKKDVKAMKKHITLLVVLPILLLLSSEIFSATNNLNFRYINPGANQLKGVNIKLSPELEFSLSDYLSKTNFKNHAGFRDFFKSRFTNRFLKKPAQYEEVVEGIGNEIKVTRVLTLSFKNPCDPRIPVEQSFCLKKTDRVIPKETKNEIASMRKKLKKQFLTARNEDKRKAFLRLLKLSDMDLLGYVLNQSSAEKTIKQISTLPLVTKKSDFTRKLKSSKLKKKKSQLKANPKINLKPKVIPSIDEINEGKISADKPIHQTLSYIPMTRNTDRVSYPFNSKNHYSKNLVMGKSYEKSYRNQFEVTFAKETTWHNRYYFGFYYYLGFEFGLKFPFILNVDTEITHVHEENRKMLVKYPASGLCEKADNASQAHLCAALGKATIQAIPVSTRDSNNQFYRDAGIPENKIDSREFTFKISADCYLTVSVPGYKKNYECPNFINVDKSQDFIPPLGFGDEKDIVSYYIPDDVAKAVPLGYSNPGGLGYAILMPGVVISGEDGTLSFDVVQHVAKLRPEINNLTLDKRSKSLSISERTMHHHGSDWGFKIKNPKYSLNASLVPSIKAQVGIDFVYEWKKTFKPFKLDSLKINLGRSQFKNKTPVREHLFIMGTTRKN